MSNVLTGKIVITAPGAEAAFQSVATGVKKTDAAIIKLNPALSKFGETLETLKAKAAARREFLNVEKDITKIGILNKELTVLEAEILRVSNIGKQGFDNLGNAISKVPPQLATVANGAGKTFSVLRQAAYILPGIGIAGLIGGLTDLVAGLFDTANAFSALDIAAGKFDNTIKGIKDDIESLKDSLEFEGKIQKLGLELSGLSGVNLSVGKTGIDIAQSTKLIPELDSKIKQLNESNKNLVSGFLKANEVLGQFGAGSQLVNLVRQFGAIENIPSSLGDKLGKTDKELLRQYQATNTELKALQKLRTETIQGIGIGGLGILVDVQKEVTDKIKENAEKQKQAVNEARQAYEKYVNETIANAKRLSEAFKTSIDLKLNFSPFDTKGDELKKSLSFLDKFNKGDFKFVFDAAVKINIKDVESPIEPITTAATKFGDLFAGEVAKYTASPEYTAEFFELDTLGKAFLLQQKEMEAAAATLTQAFASAIGRGLSDSIGAIGEGLGNILSGKSFGTAIFDALGSLIQSLGKALIQFAVIDKIVKAILENPLTIGPGVALAAGIAAIAFGAAIKNLGKRADGGPVVGGQPYLVGERGPEIFTPNTGGGITANHQLGGRGNVSGSGMMGGQVVFKIAGKELIGVLSLAQQSQNRLV